MAPNFFCVMAIYYHNQFEANGKYFNTHWFELIRRNRKTNMTFNCFLWSNYAQRSYFAARRDMLNPSLDVPLQQEHFRNIAFQKGLISIGYGVAKRWVGNPQQLSTIGMRECMHQMHTNTRNGACSPGACQTQNWTSILI